MPYIIRLKRKNGTVVNLPGMLPGPTPEQGAEFSFSQPGFSILTVRVNAITTQHSVSPSQGVQAIDLVLAQEL